MRVAMEIALVNDFVVAGLLVHHFTINNFQHFELISIRFVWLPRHLAFLNILNTHTFLKKVTTLLLASKLNLGIISHLVSYNPNAMRV